MVNSYKINVIGMGYIGVPTALMLSSSGYSVVGTDCDVYKIEELSKGRIELKEDGIDEIFDRALLNGLVFEKEPVEADVYIISVPTPFDKENKKVVADYIIDATKSTIKKAKQESIIVIESTVSPGTIRRYIQPIVEAENDRVEKKISIVHAPERIIPGKMIEELTKNDRVIGSNDTHAAKIIKEIYGTFCKGKIVVTDIETAEMCKVVENTYRDINIAYANELVKICKSANLDVYKVIECANMHPRVNILSPGPGVGGHCIAVDPWFLVGDYPGLANIILAARKINDAMPEYVLEKISNIMADYGIERNERVGLYGLAYKENVDDVRESPTLQLLDCMKKHLASGVKVYDPYVNKKIVNNQLMDFEEFINAVDLVVIMVAHEEIVKNENMLKGKIVFDTKNCLKNIETIKL